MTWSAVSYRGRIVCYELVGDRLEARELGHAQPVEVTDELREAVAADQARAARKLEEP